MSTIYNKKGQMHAQGFLLLLAIIVVGAILIFGLLAIVNAFTRMGEAEQVLFVKNMEEDLELLIKKPGARELTYQVPDRVQRMIIIDARYKETLIDHPFIATEPVVLDSLKSGELKNMFLFGSEGLIGSYWIGNVTVGHVGNEVCTGVGEFNTTTSKLIVSVTNKPGTGLIVGKDCGELEYLTASASSLTIKPEGSLVKSINNREIKLKRDRVNSTGIYGTSYLSTGAVNSSSFLISNRAELDRIFFTVETPSSTKITFRIGFFTPTGWEFYGSNLTAINKEDQGYYYTKLGETINTPENFERIIVETHLFSSQNREHTPTFSKVSLSYSGTIASKDHCVKAQEYGLCKGLNLAFEEGTQSMCCNKHNLCCGGAP
jgi:hypothetical protein